MVLAMSVMSAGATAFFLCVGVIFFFVAVLASVLGPGDPPSPRHWLRWELFVALGLLFVFIPAAYNALAAT